jgi:predicted DNA-binding protein (UPF0251 family)
MFKPNGIPSIKLKKLVRDADEFAALALGDVQRMSQLNAAASMGIPRQTLGHLLASVRKKSPPPSPKGMQSCCLKQINKESL